MILNFKSQEHAEEWTQFFSQKLDEKVLLHKEVANRFFKTDDLKEFSPAGLQFLQYIVSDLSLECNAFIKETYPEDYQSQKSRYLTEE